jgi:serine/threonine protein kinase
MSVLGEPGGFGVVVSPAIPDGDRDVTGYITKLFYEEEERDKAMATAALIREKVPLIDNPHEAYTRPSIPYAELSVSVKAALQKKQEDDGEYFLNERTLLYPILMRNRGVAIKEIRQLAYTPQKTQLLRLLETVKQIKDAGYIHGDVHTGNLLLDAAGIFTLIDYDLLMERGRFIENYHYPRTILPPESFIILKNRPVEYSLSGLASADNVDEFVDWGIPGALPERMREQFRKDTIDGVLGYFDTEDREELQEKFLNTVDSFGIGLCLLNLLEHTASSDTLRTFLQADLLPKMVHGNVAERITIEEAITMLQGQNGGGRRRTHRRYRKRRDHRSSCRRT